MQIEERIRAFSLLGEKINSIDDDTFNSLTSKVANENPWFTKANIKMSLTGVSKLLDKKLLQEWITSYSTLHSPSTKTIALILAGNIPMVGFHDILCVLIAGHKVQIKPSSKDTVLITYLLDQLIEVEPKFEPFIKLTDKLKDFDAVIATGSDNSYRYFDYYFRKYPSVIRKNRTSCAILDGYESEEELFQLGRDVFSYFGLGCRNVSKLFIPKEYDFSSLLKQWESFSEIIHHHKYANNYDYQKAIMMVNQTGFFDNGFVLITPSDMLVSPISVLYYEFYESAQDLLLKMKPFSEKIQCVVGKKFPANVVFGQAQFPGPNDYPDQVDTLKFLAEV